MLGIFKVIQECLPESTADGRNTPINANLFNVA